MEGRVAVEGKAVASLYFWVIAFFGYSVFFPYTCIVIAIIDHGLSIQFDVDANDNPKNHFAPDCCSVRVTFKQRR